MSASAGRVLVLHKGEYNAATTYSAMDEVSYYGSNYRAKQTTTGNVPTNTTYWQLVTKGISGFSVVNGVPMITYLKEE